MQLESSQLLQRLKPLFQENFEKFGELGAAVSVWQNGKPIIDLCGGVLGARRGKPRVGGTLFFVGVGAEGNRSAGVLATFAEDKIHISQTGGQFWPQVVPAGGGKS